MATSRKELESKVVDAGGKVRSVSKELDYLVVADPSASSTKLTKAKKLGIRVISEQDFIKMVE